MQITADTATIGTQLENLGAYSSIVYVSGSLGGGVASIGYRTSEGFIALNDTATLSIDTQYKIEHGLNMQLYVTLTGATDPSLTLIVRPFK